MDVNPGKENVIAFVWDRMLQTYRAVRQIRDSFDESFRFVSKSREESEPRHRVHGELPRRRNEARHVLIGREFAACNAHNEWQRFKSEHPALIFGVNFVNHSFMEFRILDEKQLCEKYEKFRDIEDRDIDIDSLGIYQRSKRIVMLYNLVLFRKLELQDADACVEQCLVPDIWRLFELLKSQMEWDNLANARSNVDVEMRDRFVKIKSQTVEQVAKLEQKYGSNSEIVTAAEARQFANLETMSIKSDGCGEVFKKARAMRSLLPELSVDTYNNEN